MKGRKLRRALLRRNAGTLERACEDGLTFVDLAALVGAGRYVACPRGSTVRLSLRAPGSRWTVGQAVRVAGGWQLPRLRRRST